MNNFVKMNKFVNWLHDLTKDERGSVSVKPVIAIMGAVFLCVVMAINCTIDPSIKPADILVDAIVIITAIGMGADSIDKFSFKGKAASTKTSKPTTSQE